MVFALCQNNANTLEESLGKEVCFFMFKKLSIIVAVCAISLLFAVSASADTVSVGVVNADALNVRSAPGTENSVIGLLPTNSEVTILSTENNWHKIFYGGVDAYVSADYVIVTATNVEKDLTLNTVPYSNGQIPSYIGSMVPGERLVELSKLYIGTPYVYGGMSPAGFDCSGFVKYCCSLMGVDMNRVAADQALNGYEVPVSDMKPGDILCFSSYIGSSYIGHSGIYVGNGYFIHSPRTGYNVEIVALSETSYGKRIMNVRRIF